MKYKQAKRLDKALELILDSNANDKKISKSELMSICKLDNDDFKLLEKYILFTLIEQRGDYIPYKIHCILP